MRKQYTGFVKYVLITSCPKIERIIRISRAIRHQYPRAIQHQYAKGLRTNYSPHLREISVLFGMVRMERRENNKSDSSSPRRIGLLQMKVSFDPQGVFTSPQGVFTSPKRVFTSPKGVFTSPTKHVRPKDTYRRSCHLHA